MPELDKAIEIIASHFPNTDYKRSIELLRNERELEMESTNKIREPLADYLEHLYEQEQRDGLDWTDSKQKLTVTYNLTLRERLKALLTGNYDAPVGIFVKQGLAMGFDWQTEDIIQTLKNSQ